MSKVTRAAFRRRGFAQAGVITQWPAIVGEELAACSAPERLTFPPGEGSGGTLHVRVSGGFALELQHLEPVVVDRINTYFGYRAVRRLAMKQGPLPEVKRRPRRKTRRLSDAENAKLDENVAATSDAELRAALRDLGHGLAADDEAPGRRDE